MEMASTLLNADPATKPHATTTSATFTINCVSPPIDLLSLPTTTESFAAVYAQFGVADVVNELLKGIETLLNDQSRPVVSAPEAASGGKNAVVQEEEEEAFSLFGEPARSEEEDDSEDDEDDQHGLSQTQAVRIFFYFLKKRKEKEKEPRLNSLFTDTCPACCRPSIQLYQELCCALIRCRRGMACRGRWPQWPRALLLER